MDFLFEPTHLVVLAIILGILYFAGPKVPEMSRSLGKSLRIFKSELKNVTDEVKGARDDVHALDAGEDRADLHKPGMSGADVFEAVREPARVQPSAPAAPTARPVTADAAARPVTQAPVAQAPVTQGPVTQTSGTRTPVTQTPVQPGRNRPRPGPRPSADASR